MVLGLGSGATDSWAPGSDLGVALPPGFVAQPFDCPLGSDFDASQKVGMCVSAAYDPVYTQVVASGPKTYYNLDGSVAGAEPGSLAQWLPGVSNAVVLGALGLLLVLKLSR